ncbi:MAG: class I SAM-dependent methyltransferase [Bacteroidia bacterium]|nr:class I SAM-dependent methyltransferase [Bacteroidia bacterium]
MYPVPSHSQKKVHFKSSGNPEFEKAYLKAHSRANRIVSDAELRELPNTFFYTMHRQQWSVRANLCQKLISYLSKGKEEPKIMDLGCGNGWLAANMAQIKDSTITAVDINMTELEQAAKVFPEKNLEFFFGDIYEDIFPKNSFDYLILFDVICYFPKLDRLINRCREYLKDGGEIHILESPFYQEKDIDAARKEKASYYHELRSEDMIDFHFFHDKQILNNYDFSILYRPSWLKSLFNNDLSQHPWIRIVN